MPYWSIVTRSFQIAWDHKYLWLIAFFSGETGASTSYSSQSYTRRANNPPNVSTISQNVMTWVTDHVTLLLALAVLWLLVVIAFFILSAVCEGATIRGSAEHDAERPFGLGMAWRTGLHLMWVMVRFRLIIVALELPLVALIVAWVIGLLIAIAHQDAGAIVPLLLTGLPLLVVWFVYGSYLFFLDRLGARAVVLEESKATASIARANRLLFKRIGRTLLVWLLSIGVGLVVALALACVSALLLAPFAAIAIFASSGNSLAMVALGLTVAIIFVPIFLVIAGFFAAQTSTYWTLAFRRLDVEYPTA